MAAFELLHRRGDAVAARITDDAVATDDDMRLVFGRGSQGRALLRGLPGFLNVDAEMLFSARLEALPAGQVVLELLETVHIDERVINRCADLKRRGFRFALDDVCECREEQESLLALVDIVKVDLPGLDDTQLEALVSKLRRFPLRLLAEKVASSRSAQRCRELQFDLFQGYHFDRPAPAAAAA
ncbi:MAG TPA: EAL domain-containing protein [Azonexus sp.]